MGEHDRTDPIVGQDAPPFGESLRHGFFKPFAVFSAPLWLLRFVLNRLALLGRERIAGIERVLQQGLAGQNAFQPDQEEVGEVGVRNCVVVGRVCEPDARRLIR